MEAVAARKPVAPFVIDPEASVSPICNWTEARPPEMAVCKSETFGPVTSIYPIDRYEEGFAPSGSGLRYCDLMHAQRRCSGPALGGYSLELCHRTTHARNIAFQAPRYLA